MTIKILFVFILLFNIHYVYSQKEYTNIDKAIKNSDKVLFLNLSNQNLKVLPNEIVYFTNLKKLNLSYNKLEFFPELILGLTNLEVLILNNNNIKEIPTEIRKLKKLKVLWIYSNCLESIPVEIKELTELEQLNITDNLINTKVIEKIKCNVNKKCRVIYSQDFGESPPYKCP